MESFLTTVPVRPGRPEGWEQRLATVIRNAVHRHFEVRDWNCARFAHTCAQAVAERPLPYAWKGSLAESVDALFARVPRQLAQRGDVVLASVPEPSLGVCVGREALFVTVRGLLRLPMTSVSLAWMV